ncbi:MAG: fatty acid hydroxylase family protein [Gammaproteobacteria bacterium]|nr:fatty acid hydroxylase family protein [Gammaproteobacteria bacterium]
MELTETPMSQRQRVYRQVYRERIATWYNGYLHIFIIYTMGFGALYIYGAHIQEVRWWEWLTVPAVLVIANLFEWWIHTKVMHRPKKDKGSRAIYTRHTLMHHQFFTRDEMRFAGQHDWRVTVFPPYALVVFILMTIPPALITGFLVSANVGWLMVSTTTSIYLLYEFMHFCCHVEENWFVRYCPFVNTIRRHHSAHHDASNMMEVNMNLTLPFADWLFGTSDLNRGLLGHLINGYETKYVKTDLKQAAHSQKSTSNK